MNVHEFMTTKLEFVDGGASVYEAVEKMVDKRIRSLVVRFSGKDDGYGVITARDVVFRVLAKGINPQKMKVAEIASKPLIIINQDADLNEASGLMEKSNVARLFVSDGQRLVGLVSLMEVMRAMLIIIARGKYVL